MEEKPQCRDTGFLELLKPIFRRLSERSLLLRCLPGYSQNQNESLNSIVWSKAPKHKFKGPKSIEMAGMSAILQFDHGHHTKAGAQKKDNKRLSDSVRDASALEKRRRVAQRQAKLVQEQENLHKEDHHIQVVRIMLIHLIPHSDQINEQNY